MKNLITKKLKYIILFFIIFLALYFVIIINLHEKKKSYLVPKVQPNEVTIYEEKEKAEKEELLKLIECYNNKKLLVLTFDDGPR